VAGNMLDAVLVGFLLGDVPVDGDMSVGTPDAVVNPGNGKPDGEYLTTFAAIPDLPLPAPVGNQFLPQILVKGLILFVGFQQVRLPAHQFTDAVAGDVAKGLIGHGDAVVAVGDKQALVARFDHPGIEQELALGLGPAALAVQHIQAVGQVVGQLLQQVHQLGGEVAWLFGIEGNIAPDAVLAFDGARRHGVQIPGAGLFLPGHAVAVAIKIVRNDASPREYRLSARSPAFRKIRVGADGDVIQVVGGAAVTGHRGNAPVLFHFAHPHQLQATVVSGDAAHLVENLLWLFGADNGGVHRTEGGVIVIELVQFPIRHLAGGDVLVGNHDPQLAIVGKAGDMGEEPAFPGV